eukprot:2039269-Amphidinium_carterae.2
MGLSASLARTFDEAWSQWTSRCGTIRTHYGNCSASPDAKAKQTTALYTNRKCQRAESLKPTFSAARSSAQAKKRSSGCCWLASSRRSPSGKTTVTWANLEGYTMRMTVLQHPLHRKNEELGRKSSVMNASRALLKPRVFKQK